MLLAAQSHATTLSKGLSRYGRSERQRQDYEQQRQAYDARYPNASRYYTDHYGRQYNNGAYGGATYSQPSQYPDTESDTYPDGRPSRYSNYPNGE